MNKIMDNKTLVKAGILIIKAKLVIILFVTTK